MTDARDQRPRPQYGEYASEGAESSPTPQADGAQSPSQGSHDAASGSADSGSADSSSADSHAVAQPSAAAQPTPTPAAHSSATGAAPNRLPGVPHNLGARNAAPPHIPAAPPTAPVASGDRTEPQPQPQPPQAPAQHGEPYRATEIPGGRTAQDGAHGPAADAGQLPKPRTADRLITIVLLVLGAYGALNSGFAMMQLSTEVTRLGRILGIEDFVAPSQITVIGNIGAIVMLVLYALVLVFSIRRLRARKLTFWAPLAAGALALVVYFVLAIIAYVQSPELMQAMMQPDALQTVLNSLEGQTS